MKRCLLSALAVGLSLAANVMAQVPSYVPTNGLVGWWPFNGNANDESGNGNNGTVNGATLTTDRFGNANKAFSFDGISSVISIADNPSLNFETTNTFTFSYWLSPTSLSSSQLSVILSKQTGSASSQDGFNSSVEYNFSSNYRIQNGSGNSSFSIGTQVNSININTWKHVVQTWSGNVGQIFIDGQLISSTTGVCVVGNNSANLLIAQPNWVASNAKGFHGELDDIGIWNRVLTECEIQDLYNAQLNSVAGSVNISPQPALIGSTSILSTASQSQNIQWQSNPSNFGWLNVLSNANYSGGTTNTLTVNNVQLANHNQPFRVIASNGNCIDTSNITTIQIADTCITNVTVYDTLLTTVTDTLIINTTLSLPAPNNENTILIYPNPASDHITIDNGNYTATAGYTIKIENNAGQQVFQSLINQAQFYVDLSTWSGNGLYFVHLIDAQGNTVTVRKIVLQ
jgi:hypothetical protein